MRAGEDINCVRNRIEHTEQINEHFSKNGIKTSLAVSHNGSYTHSASDEIWVAYPWLDAEPIVKVDAKFCYEVGRLLGQMHNVPSSFQYVNEAIAFHKPNLSWKYEVDNICNDRLLPFNLAFTDIERYSTWGYSCANELMKSENTILSHNDLHKGNILLRNNQFVIIDWELSGSVCPSVEMFDVGLSLCGFCDGNTNLQLFDNVIKGYSEVYNGYSLISNSELAIGALCVLIIEHMSINLNDYFLTGNQDSLDRAERFLGQFNELKKHEKLFEQIMDNYHK